MGMNMGTETMTIHDPKMPKENGADPDRSIHPGSGRRRDPRVSQGSTG